MCELQCVSVLHDSLVGADMNHAFRLSEVKRETCPAGTSDFDRLRYIYLFTNASSSMSACLARIVISCHTSLCGQLPNTATKTRTPLSHPRLFREPLQSPRR